MRGSQGAKDLPGHTGRQTSLLRWQKGEGNSTKINVACWTSNSKRSFGLIFMRTFSLLLMEGWTCSHYHLSARILLEQNLFENVVIVHVMFWHSSTNEHTGHSVEFCLGFLGYRRRFGTVSQSWLCQVWLLSNSHRSNCACVLDRLLLWQWHRCRCWSEFMPMHFCRALQREFSTRFCTLLPTSENTILKTLLCGLFSTKAIWSSLCLMRKQLFPLQSCALGSFVALSLCCIYHLLGEVWFQSFFFTLCF